MSIVIKPGENVELFIETVGGQVVGDFEWSIPMGGNHGNIVTVVGREDGCGTKAADLTAKAPGSTFVRVKGVIKVGDREWKMAQDIQITVTDEPFLRVTPRYVRRLTSAPTQVQEPAMETDHVDRPSKLEAERDRLRTGLNDIANMGAPGASYRASECLKAAHDIASEGEVKGG